MALGDLVQNGRIGFVQNNVKVLDLEDGLERRRIQPPDALEGGEGDGTKVGQFRSQCQKRVEK